MTSRKASKERTRSRLIQATLKILHQKGPGALTTGRIAEAAGVAQPTFYVHFDGMDAALEQAAQTVADALRSRLRDYREGVREAGAFEAVRLAYSLSVDALLADRRAATLVLRHRRDVASPLGKRWSALIADAREDLLADLAAAGVTDQIEQPGLFADMVIGMTLTLVEGVLDGRIAADEKDAAIDTMVRTTMAGIEESRGKRRKASAA